MTDDPSHGAGMAPTDEFTPSRPFPLTPTEAALIDLEKGHAAMAKRMKALGKEPEQQMDEISPYDAILFSRPVRIEIDVCVPIADLRKMIGEVRNELTNALAALERNDTPVQKRHAAHNALSRAKAHVYFKRRELKLRAMTKSKDSL